MRFVPPDGITIGGLYRLTESTDAEFRMFLTRLSKWWGYVSISPNKVDKPTRQSQAARLVRPTAGGLKALGAWRPLTGIIEERWQKRFGEANMKTLRESMGAFVRKFDRTLPESLPILGHDALSKLTKRDYASEGGGFPGLLSKILLAFALEYESSMKFSLAIGSNLLRVVGPKGVLTRDLPQLSGIAKPGIDLAMNRLFFWDLAVPQTAPAARAWRRVTLTAEGKQVHERHCRTVEDLERRWQSSYGKADIENIRALLEEVVGDPAPGQSRLFEGLKPYADGWRAAVPKREVLPHFPMILHRGGFPDGS